MASLFARAQIYTSGKPPIVPETFLGEFRLASNPHPFSTAVKSLRTAQRAQIVEQRQLQWCLRSRLYIVHILAVNFYPI